MMIDLIGNIARFGQDVAFTSCTNHPVALGVVTSIDMGACLNIKNGTNVASASSPVLNKPGARGLD